MRRFSAQYIITGTGDILKRGIITTDRNGLITGVTPTAGELPELSQTEFYNGIIVPGFINCHCHLELSAMHRQVSPGGGLGSFIQKVREARPPVNEDSEKSIAAADKMMYDKGTSACADICNGSTSFETKEKSPVSYINFLEVFGVDPLKAPKRISEVLELKKTAGKYSAPSYIVPHSFYSASARLLEMIKELASGNELNTVHFMESEQEALLMKESAGPLMESYRAMGIDDAVLHDRVVSHLAGIRDYISGSGNLVLVHNTFASPADIKAAAARPDTYFCICPGSNIFIENALPPVNRLREEGVTIVTGTDSLASNNSLNILDELKLISNNFPAVPLAEMIGWATINGARALKADGRYGSIEIGKKPGLVLIENADLAAVRLTEHSTSRRLI